MRRSESRPDSLSIDSTRQKVDAAFFRPEDAPSDHRPHWVDQYLPVEFKNRKNGNILDPFNDKKHDVSEEEAATRKKNRGQLITYAELLLALQPRVYLFMLAIIGRRFRLLLWDRSGVIVTKSTDYYKRPELLCEFLWRISYASPTALGLDPTAVRFLRTPTNANELESILEYLAERVIDRAPGDIKGTLPDNYVFSYVLDLFKESIANEDWPLYRLWVAERCFLVGKPVSPSRGVAGPGTRGYVAYDFEHKRLVWLKDTWRAWYQGVEAEGKVLCRLNEAGAEGIPTVLSHGDVGDQATVTGKVWEREHPLSYPYPRPSAPCSTPPPVPTTSDPVDKEAGTERPRMKSYKKRKRENLDNECMTSTLLGPKGHVPSFRVDCPIEHRRHYRIVFKEVCFPLKEFMDAKQLVTIIFHCLNGEWRHSSDQGDFVVDTVLPLLSALRSGKQAASSRPSS